MESADIDLSTRIQPVTWGSFAAYWSIRNGPTHPANGMNIRGQFWERDLSEDGSPYMTLSYRESLSMESWVEVAFG